MYSAVGVAIPIRKYEHPPCFSGDGRKLKLPNMCDFHANVNSWILFEHLHTIHKTGTIHINIGLRHVRVTTVAVEK